MKFYKETEASKPLYVTTIDNGVILCVFNGYAKGIDGKTYYPVMRAKDDDYILVGWSDETDSSVIIEWVENHKRFLNQGKI